MKARPPHTPPSNLPFDTERLRAQDRHWIHPWENFKTVDTIERTIIAQAEGIYVYDSDGNRLIDGPGGMWCVNIGHGNGEIADAVAEQIRRMSYFSPWSLSNPPAAELSEKLAELAPGDLKHVFFTTGGSTAVDSALRFVMYLNNCLGRPEKKHIISRQDAYHGGTYLSASCSGKVRDKAHLDFETGFIHHLPSPNPYRRPEGMSVEDFCDAKVADLENEILELGADKVAAFIAEPILASGGVIVPPPGYHAKCLEVCRKYDVLTIADEVVTAFGRLGHFFASEAVFGVVPDIITVAKGITSAYVPLGAVLISDRLVEQLNGEQAENGYFASGFTYSGHPVACAAALKNIEIMEREKLFDNVREVGVYFEEQLRTLLDLPIVGDIRGRLFMMCVVNVMDKKTKEFFPPEVNIGKRISNYAEEQGLIVRPAADLNIMSPPLTMTKQDVDYLIPRLRSAIEATMVDLIKEGYLSA